MEISPEMVQDAIKTIVKKHQESSCLRDGRTFRSSEEWDEIERKLDEEWDALTKELTEHAYSFAELPAPVWRK